MSDTYREPVRATQKGYYAGSIQNPGDVFVITRAADFSENWMEHIDEKNLAAYVSERDRLAKLAENAGAIQQGKTLTVDGKVMTVDQAVHQELGDEQEVKPVKAGEPGKDPNDDEGTKTVVVGGLAHEVPASYDPDKDPGKPSLPRNPVTGKEVAEPAPSARIAPPAPKPSKK